ncbi:dTDP-4-dehydrorhamnose 3,5-epimerase [Methylobacillus sp. Pita2]|uniref:dTDP-4-dehydrorhamnose 3,5-epimerase n=1 Tax=Methylobacillus sp. Pita2 TaxID=3383245 RepID=UPI0038B4F6B7
MNVTPTSIPEVLVLDPKVFGDERGFFFESYNQQTFAAATGVNMPFVQDNHSMSKQGVLRGLHYQVQHPQGKLVRVLSGAVFDVAVDIRRSSPTFGEWIGEYLSAENKKQMWIPPGFAHGFLVLSAQAEFLYKTTDFYSPEHERCITWNDPDIGIVWPDSGVDLQLSSKDMQGDSLALAELFD